MFKVSGKKDEVMKITFSQGNFDSGEIEKITESFSKIVPVERRYYIRETVGILPAVLIFSIGFVLGSIAQGFFKAMGSDLYRIAKDKVIKILKNKKVPSLIFEMFYKGTKISIICRTKDERTLNEVFNTIDKARDIAIKELDRKETPEMTEMMIHYDESWILDSGQNWKAPKVIKFYKYNKKTGKWKLTRDWSIRQ